MLVAECPGRQEDRVGYPLVGKTGQETDAYLNGDDLPTRDHIYLTNLYKQFVHEDYEYTAADLERDAPELLAELAAVRPQLIVTLGRHATRWFLGDVDMEDVHSMGWCLPVTAPAHAVTGDVLIFPIYHPAAGFHNPEIQAYVSYGFRQLATFVAQDRPEGRRLHDDPYAGREVYVEGTLPSTGEWVALDTEGSAAAPWSLQWATDPGTGALLRFGAEPLRGPGTVLSCLRQYRRLLLHHAIHDLSVLQAGHVGVFDPAWADGRFDDTMTMAYLLQVEPQGLKALATRWAGMKMRSYEEVLGDASERRARDWLGDLLYQCAESHREARWDAYLAAVDGGRRLTTLPTLPKSRVHRSAERCLRSRRPRALWDDQALDVHVAAHDLAGDMPEATLSDIPLAEATTYACRDADATLRIAGPLLKRVQDMGLEPLYRLELSTYPLLARMMQVGMLPDLDHFAGLATYLQDKLDGLQAQLAHLTEQPAFNANSGDQVAAYVFDRLGLAGHKKTASGRLSTNDKVLEALERAHGHRYPGLGLIRQFRETYKLRNTFVVRIPEFVDRWPHDGRVHTTIKATRTVTGRKATANPNLMAQPEHGADAALFQAGWIAAPGHVVCTWDQSQIELRGLAHLSQDPYMLGVFRGEIRNPDGSLIDLHAGLAHRIFGVPPAKQDKHRHRLPAKAVNFGIPMGMTAVGLALELRKNGLVEVTEDDAQRWIDEADRLYAAVPRYKQAKITEAECTGAVRCLSGRLRYIGGIRSPNEAIRSEAERFAFSTPIQESAQYVMKWCEHYVWTTIIVPHLRAGRYCEPLLQIHDALKLEVAEGLQQDVHTQMVECMTRMPARLLSVPLAIDGSWGPNFRDQISFDEGDD